MSNDKLKESVMNAIERGKVRMRPRWHFFLLSTFAAVGTLLILLSTVYVVSLGVFFLQRSGVWYAPSFGGRGWFSLLHGLPWLLILLVVVFAVVLELLVRHYRFVYQKPLGVSLIAIVAVALVGGIVLPLSPLHRAAYFLERHGELPPPVDLVYRGVPHGPDGDVYRGYIASSSGKELLIVDEEGEGTTTVILTPRTRYPYGEDFSRGDLLVIIGDSVGTDTIEAFGVREIGEE